MLTNQVMLSVIIINHNTPDVTLKCLDHLYRSRNVELETILINNTSEGRVSYPKIKIINNKNPLGFGANNNQAMKVAKGDKILLLNSDCLVQPDTLAACNATNFDVVGCRLTDANGKTIQSTGYFPTLRRVTQLMLFIDNFPVIRKFIDTIHIRDTSRLSKTHRIDWIQGAFMMLKKEVYRKVGGFDENFHMYGEEVEWQYRIKKAGFKIWYFADAQAVHLERQTVKFLSPAYALIGEMKGYVYFFKLHRPKWEQVVLPWILRLGSLIRIPLQKDYVEVLRAFV